MKTYNWKEAQELCKTLTIGDYSDWRLPTIKELQTLLDYGNYSPALPCKHPFLNVQSNLYWSSSSYVLYTDYAWNVIMNAGYVNHYNKSNHYYVWPVRAGVKKRCKQRFTDNGDGTINDNLNGLCWVNDLEDVK